MSKIVYDAGKRSGALTGEIIKTIIKIVITSIVSGLLSLIPILGWISAIVGAIYVIIDIVGLIIVVVAYSSASFVLTEDGISSKNSIASWDLTFDQISRVYVAKKKIMVETTIPVKPGKQKTKVFQYIFAEDPHSFCKAFNAQKARAMSPNA